MPGRPDWTRDAALDVTVDGATDGLAQLGGLPIPLGPLTLADFEDGTGNFSTPTGSSAVDTTNPIDGSGSLEATASPTEVVDTSAGPAQGDVYCGSVRTPPSGGQSELWYGVQDSSNLYFVGLDSVNDEVTMGFYSGGGKTVNDTVSASIAAGTVYDIELTWRTDGSQQADVSVRPGSDIDP